MQQDFQLVRSNNQLTEEIDLTRAVTLACAIQAGIILRNNLVIPVAEELLIEAVGRGGGRKNASNTMKDRDNVD